MSIRRLTMATVLLLSTLSACSGSDTNHSMSDSEVSMVDSGGFASDAEASDGSSAGSDSGEPTEDGGNPIHDGGRDADVDSDMGVDLGTAAGFVILAKSGVSTVPPSDVTGDIGVSPAAASYITGFSVTADATNAFSTSPQVTGKLFAANYAVPTPAKLTTAVSDMLLAYAAAAGRAPDTTELGAGNIGGMTLTPGIYKWGTGLLIPSDVTLHGEATDVWVFQVAQNLTMGSAVKLHLTGGALASHVFWQVAGKVELGTTAHLEGVVLAQTSITLRTGASVNGRLLAQTAVSLDACTVAQPAP
jgi:hypothetical protein